MGICMSKKKYYTITDNNYDYLLYDEPDNKIIYNEETQLAYDNENRTYHNSDCNMINTQFKSGLIPEELCTPDLSQLVMGEDIPYMYDEPERYYYNIIDDSVYYSAHSYAS